MNSIKTFATTAPALASKGTSYGTFSGTPLRLVLSTETVAAMRAAGSKLDR